ncbi:hypothetical protein [Streptomyces zaomyceticus]|uniref:hypothetical protein n=1 Tax=Streptomyces zaomyceticus TaxID=68286 RepID=UPI0037A0A096
MNQITDRTAEEVQEAARSVVLAVADHITATNPTDALEHANLLVCVGAEAYLLADRSYNGKGQAISKVAMALVPELTEGTTRGEFALILRRAVPRADWGDDADERVIPVFPHPRTEPVPDERPTVPVQPTEVNG